ncbi:hypothetical protein PGH07_07625 [Sulfurovum sp. zt1-1]|uniref:Lipoprotein n=1 Tax=Sulfurovum zhangzhouensis TaxID=3019067 RepID=A0ABT7QYY5_9BACT|nr:hypothetical protein [Sulfurovum zhangzhouensis]MDM5272045.1 hypothetical protein [Sulfurovum zhangzhouensis]
MKRTKNAIFIGILLCISFSFNGCEEKKTKTDTELPVENSTEIIGAPDTNITQKKMFTSTSVKGKPAHKSTTSGSLLFQDRSGKKYTLTIQGGKLLPDTQSKPILLINFFDMNDHDSMAQIPYLTKLQDKYHDRLTVLGIPTNQSIDEENLKAFISMNQIDYFISYDSSHDTLINIFSELLDSDNLTTPTTLLYHKGETDSIYEGAVPIEMITHDILMINKD